MTILDDDLYDLLPEYHRQQDAWLGHPLRALFRVMVREGAQVVDADLDRLHDAPFVETCAEELLPRLAALVGVRPLRPLPPSAAVSMRAFVGNVLRYRRAKGTPLTLELLARDVTAFSAMAVELYARLAVTLTVRAPRADRLATPLARDAEGRARRGTAFDRDPRLADVRSIARAGGRYHLPHVGVFVWRLECTPYVAPDAASATREALATAPPALSWGGHAGHFALAPAGRTLPLFSPPWNPDRGSPRERDVPDRLRRLPLWRELEDRRLALAQGRTPRGEWFDERPPFTVFVRRDQEADFRRIPPEEIVIGALRTGPAAPPPPWTRPAPTRGYPRDRATTVDLPIGVVLDPATGRMVFPAPAQGQPDVVEVRVAYATGQSGELGGGAYARAAPEPVRAGALVYVVGGPLPAAPGTIAAASLAAALASWENAGAGRSGYVVITDNAVDLPDNAQATLDFAMPRGSALTIVAAEWRAAAGGAPGDEIGFLVRESRRCQLLRRLRVAAGQGPPAGAGTLVLDGAWCEAGLDVAPGSLRSLLLRHCTLWPGASICLDAAGHADAPLTIRLERCVTGRVRAGLHVPGVALEDCVVARPAAGASVEAPASDLSLRHVTVLGALAARSLSASSALLMGSAQVERRQTGCLRYSYVADPGSRLPTRYRCQPDLAQQAREAALGRPLTDDERRTVRLRVGPSFLDDAPHEPGFALLRSDAPPEITRGGEEGTEMGAHGHAGHAVRVANLADLFADYVPLGLEAAVIGADRSSEEAMRSNRP